MYTQMQTKATRARTNVVGTRMAGGEGDSLSLSQSGNHRKDS
jgi:hypothetical protein